MNFYKFDSLYTKDGWIDNAYVSTNQQGLIQSITTTLPTDNSKITKINAWGIPGFLNCHSHAFQYAMAGASEYIPQQANGDDFWSWRQLMYELSLSLSPDRMQQIATQVYSQMRRVGYTSVAEFHYLHHDQSGKAYTNIAEMGARLIQAAKQANMAITLIPILYQQCDLKSAAKPEQRRFLSPSLDDYWQLLEASKAACKEYSRASIGAGIHSIRAVSPDIIKEFCNSIDEQLPIHIHIAEQQAEVSQCIEVLGTRPVNWLLENVELDGNYNLVHSTHMTADETKQLAQSDANVVLCPSTEANLGDGLFPLTEFMQHGGKWCIGTDSNIGLSPFEELRWLDYAQRLKLRQRNIACLKKPGNSGEIMFNQAYKGGLQALGYQPKDIFAENSPFDVVIIDHNHPMLIGSEKQHRLAKIIYHCDPSIIIDTMITVN